MINFFKKIFKYLILPLLGILITLRLVKSNISKQQVNDVKAADLKKKLDELNDKKIENVVVINKTVDKIEELNEDYRDDSAKKPSEDLADIVSRINSR